MNDPHHPDEDPDDLAPDDLEHDAGDEGLTSLYVGGASDEPAATEEEEPVEYAVRPNKTQLKRDLAELQALADRLTGLKPEQLESFGLEPRTIQAIMECKRIRKGGARNRQLKYITKRLSIEDTSQAVAHFDQMKVRQLVENRHFHQLETLRDQLLEEGDKALGELLDQRPDLDRQQLRQLIRAGRKELETGKPVGAGRKLFRYLRESITPAMP